MRESIDGQVEDLKRKRTQIAAAKEDMRDKMDNMDEVMKIR
jgi:chromosome segregation ATPase